MSDTPQDEQAIDVITLTDPDGEELDFGFIALVDLEEGRFAVLAPIDQLEAEEPELDLYGFTYTENGEEIELEPVEDDDLLDKIFLAAEQALLGPDDDGFEE